jgi:hypothetical protein
MLDHYPKLNPTLGLNTKYQQSLDGNEALFNEEFDTVFVPQHTYHKCGYFRKSLVCYRRYRASSKKQPTGRQ